MTQQQINQKCVETNSSHDFKTTADNCKETKLFDLVRSGSHTTIDLIAAERYDAMEWYKARAAYLEKKVAELEEKMEEHILVKKYYFEDEGGNKWYDTDEMESEFHDTMVDLGAYDEECRCCRCDCSLVGEPFNLKDGCRVCEECYEDDEEEDEDEERLVCGVCFEMEPKDVCWEFDPTVEDNVVCPKCRETNWNEDGKDELCSAIDASGNALY